MASFYCLTAFGQVTIEDCYRKAQANYPLIKQYGLIEKSRDYNLSNAGKSYLLQVMFSAKATYQSEVTEIPVSVPGIEGMTRDQYGASVDINQTIWDGGVSKAVKENIRTSAEVDKKSLEVDLYSINDRVNQLFFGILLFDERISQNELLQNDLAAIFDKVTSYIKNGVANQADLDAVKVEQLKAKQSRSQLVHTRAAYIEMLSSLIGEGLDENTPLVRPETIIPADLTIRRPELDLFDVRIKNIEARLKEINSGLMPKIGLFVTGGYGKPGLNMLKNDFSAYYIGGIRVSWNFGGLYTSKNSRRLVGLGINSVETQRETFLFNTNMDISGKESEILKFADILEYDNEIIALRRSILLSSEVKMEHGIITGIDLMRDVNAADMAAQDKILHEIELLTAIYNLRFAVND